MASLDFPCYAAGLLSHRAADRMNPATASVVYGAVDLGGTTLSVGLGTPAGEWLGEASEATRSHEGPDAVIERIARGLEALAHQARVSLAGVGIGIPGLVDVARGYTRFLPNLPSQWRDLPVAATLSNRLGCPVHLLNDARAAALGESRFGSGRAEVRSLVVFTLGTGVGGGVVLDGRLQLGPFGAAGELGHLCVEPDGPWCGCGSRGCLETLVSGPALTGEGVRLLLSGNAPMLHRICSGDVARISPATLAQAAREGEASVRFALNQAGERLGSVAAHAVSALGVEMVVLAGGVSALGDLLLAPMRRVIEQRVRMFPVDGIQVVTSPLGAKGGLYGALALAVDGGVG